MPVVEAPRKKRRGRPPGSKNKAQRTATRGKAQNGRKRGPGRPRGSGRGPGRPRGSASAPKRPRGRPRRTAAESNGGAGTKHYHILELVSHDGHQFEGMNSGDEQEQLSPGEQSENLFMKTAQAGQGASYAYRGVYESNGLNAQDRAVDAYLDEHPEKEEFVGIAIPDRFFKLQHVGVQMVPTRIRR